MNYTEYNNEMNDVLFEGEDALTNFKNYFCYAEMVKDHVKKIIYVPEDISVATINDHIDAISNILKDGIETDFVHNCKITISWGNNIECDLSIIDYWFNLFMWSMLIKIGTPIEPKHIFWDKELKKKDLKKFIDRFFLTKNNKINFSNFKLNDTICDAISKYGYIEDFSYYLANTINNEDDIRLMNANPEFYDLLHCSMANVPFDEVKDVGMDLTNRAISIIKDSKKYLGYEHSLTNSFRANEAVNPRQYKEVRINIGTKPNNEGGVYPYIIDKSFSTGGVNDPLSYLMESATSRSAQIMSKTNVGDSGDFARLLGINNTDTLLNMNPKYECMTQNFMKFDIKSNKHLYAIKDRYFRFNPRGLEYVIDDSDESLIGKTIYLRSPITCSCKSDTSHICRKCYGELYFTNLDINVGKMAAEILSSQLTQKLLSAKHLVETVINKIIWNDAFKDFFQIDINAIKINPDLQITDLKGYELVIDPEEIFLVNDADYTSSYTEDGEEYISMDNVNYNEYVTKFYIRTPEGYDIEICSTDYDEMYISQELNTIIRKKAYNKDDKIVVPLTNLVDPNGDDNDILFYIKINNNELSKTMNDIINVINKSNITQSKTKEEALQDIVDLCIDGDVSIDAIHLEVILSNQIVSVDNVLKRPNWNEPGTHYRLLTLNQSLTNNPSIIVSLLYQDTNKVLYNPLSFSKKGPSFFDLFYMEQPQIYISDELLVDHTDIKEQNKQVVMATIVKK